MLLSVKGVYNQGIFVIYYCQEIALVSTVIFQEETCRKLTKRCLLAKEAHVAHCLNSEMKL